MITKKITIITLLLFSFIFISCSDFLDVNENPNNPGTSTPDLTLAATQHDLLTINAEDMNYLGNFMVYNWAKPSNWSVNSDLIRYNFTAESFSTIFETSYANIFKNITYINNFEDGVNDYSAYKVIGNVLKGFQYQYLVDLYGKIPYTEANLREANITPAYDEAEDIYKDLILKLTEAATLATNLPDGYKVPDANQDIMFKGDMQKWAKFANTIKLRLLVRLSNTSQDAFITAEVAKITANGAGFITSNVYGNPGYSDNEDKQSPFFGYVGESPGNDSPTDRGDYTVASDYTVNFLNTTNDPRLERLYSASATAHVYKGVKQTVTLPSVAFTTKDLSHVGPGLLINSEQNQQLMLLSESLFLQAEAMVRGYLPGGVTGAKAKYEEAITASFTFLKTPAPSTDASTYFGQATNNVNWDASTDKIEAIITQKWIALNGTSGIESWIELTRTGFPKNLPISEDAITTGKRPVRLLYPASEISRNANNVPAQSKDAIFNSNPFWK